MRTLSLHTGRVDAGCRLLAGVRHARLRGADVSYGGYDQPLRERVTIAVCDPRQPRLLGQQTRDGEPEALRHSWVAVGLRDLDE